MLRPHQIIRMPNGQLCRVLAIQDGYARVTPCKEQDREKPPYSIWATGAFNISAGATVETLDLQHK